MTAVEFRAFGAYVRKVFRNDEDDDGDLGTPGRAGLRCRVWSKDRPSTVSYAKNQTFILNLAAHPGAIPNFSTAQAGDFECEAPLFTGIGNGSTSPHAPNSFEAGDDYVNRIYLSTGFISKLGALKPPFPPIPMGPLPGRKQTQGPFDYEFKIFVYSNDNVDTARRNHRYLGYYAEVVSGSGNIFTVQVFKPASDTLSGTVVLDFTKADCYGPQTTIQPSTGSSGALFLRDDLASAALLDLPKMPPGLAGEKVPPIPVPNAIAVAKAVRLRGDW